MVALLIALALTAPGPRCVSDGPRVLVVAEKAFSRGAVRQTVASALAFFSKHRLRMECNDKGRVLVRRAKLPQTWEGLLAKSGRRFDRYERNYLIFTDGSVGGYWGRASQGTRGKYTGTQWAWSTRLDPYVVAHELFHAMGVHHKASSQSLMHPNIGWRVGKWYTEHLSPLLK